MNRRAALEMNPSLSSAAKLRTILKYGFITLLVVAAIWLTVIFWWHTTQRVITLGDVLIYLVLMPAATLIALTMLQLKRSRKTRSTQTIKSSASAQPGVVASADGSKVDLPATGPAGTILAAWAITSAGDDAADFVTALRERRLRPRPDTQLCDDQGFPVMASRVTTVDTEAIHEDLRLSLTSHASHLTSLEESRDAFSRTMALLSRLLDQIGAEWPLEDADITSPLDASAQATLRGAVPVAREVDKRVQLTVKLIIPEDFEPHEQELARLYLERRLHSFPISAEKLHVEIVPSADDASALALIEQFNVNTRKAIEANALLLLTCDSKLCSGVAEDWQAAGKLFNAQNPGGLMMGEAGFGMLCINDAALSAAITAPVCGISRIANARRDISADSPGRPSSAALLEAVRNAIVFSGIESEQIATVSCDADHRTSRILECIGMMLEVLPKLDAIEHRLAINETCGHTGTASVLGSLVAGVTQVHNVGRPVLVFNVSHLFDRAAAVLIPSDSLPQIS